jgi:REP element-mobilizing transposase RayT
MLDHPAYFLSWHTYGTWLPGDERGWVDGSANAEMPVWSSDYFRRMVSGERMALPPVTLSLEQRRVVEQTAKEVCEHRRWQLCAVNCRTNHVHVVLMTTDCSPEKAMNSLKSWFSRRLNELAPHCARRQWWVRHGSTRYLNTEEAVRGAVDYVLNGQ